MRTYEGRGVPGGGIGARGGVAEEMKALLTRIKRLETVHAIELLPPVEVQIGYLKELPEEYAGERHVITVGRDPDGA